MTVQRHTPTRVFWLTNLAPPYRRPIWSILGQRQDLVIALTGRDEAVRPWSDSTTPGEPFRIIPARGSLRARWTAIRTMLGSDVVVLGGWHQPEYLIALVLNRGVRPIVAFYESSAASHRFPAGPVAWVRRAFFHAVDAVLAVGADSRDAVRSNGIDARRIVEGPQVVDNEFFRTATAAARAQTPARPGHHLVYVGQLVPRKNVETALRAWAAQARPEDRFTVIGTGELRERLAAVTVELAVTGQVSFEDHRDRQELAKLYADAQTLVLPSLREVWGMVVNESLAAGLHLVLSDRSGAVTAVGHMAGVFVSPPTQDGLTDAMVRSREQWDGPIEQPEILAFSPALFADRTLDALDLAQTLNTKRRQRRRRITSRHPRDRDD